MSEIKLIDLNPNFFNSGGEGVFRKNDSGDLIPVPERNGVGLSFDCPCGECGERVFLNFSNPIDGDEPVSSQQPHWQRTGYIIENMTLTPSIQRMGKCRWHGFLTDGILRSV
jgi:hypothetical protein